MPRYPYELEAKIKRVLKEANIRFHDVVILRDGSVKVILRSDYDADPSVPVALINAAVGVIRAAMGAVYYDAWIRLETYTTGDLEEEDWCADLVLIVKKKG